MSPHLLGRNANENDREYYSRVSNISLDAPALAVLPRRLSFPRQAPEQMNGAAVACVKIMTGSRAPFPRRVNGSL